MSTKVSVNAFVRRQVMGSGKTWSTKSFEWIVSYAEKQLERGIFKAGYRDGVKLIPVEKKDCHFFTCPFIKIEEDTPLKADVVKRRDNEDLYIQIRATSGALLKPGSVDLILYHHDVLAETNEETLNTDWELISFHAIPEGVAEMPMGPITMMRNQLQLPGGTKGVYSSDQWAESVNFWQKYTVLDSEV